MFVVASTFGFVVAAPAPRARHAAPGRCDAAPGAPDDPRRVRGRGAARRRRGVPARDGAAPALRRRCCGRAASSISSSRDAGALARLGGGRAVRRRGRPGGQLASVASGLPGLARSPRSRRPAIERRRPELLAAARGHPVPRPRWSPCSCCRGVMHPLFALLCAILLPEVAGDRAGLLRRVLFPLLAGWLAVPFVRRDVAARLAREHLRTAARIPAALAAPILAISAIAGSMIVALSFTADWTAGAGPPAAAALRSSSRPVATRRSSTVLRPDPQSMSSTRAAARRCGR